MLVGADRDTFDVAGTELVDAMPESARYHRRVSYQRTVVSNQHVHAVDAMYPVVGSEVGSNASRTSASAARDCAGNSSPGSTITTPTIPACCYISTEIRVTLRHW